jgi:hypothetical protein
MSQDQSNILKPAAIGCQICGGVLSLGALVRLFTGFSFAALISLVIGVCFLWAGRRLFQLILPILTILIVCFVAVPLALTCIALDWLVTSDLMGRCRENWRRRR